MVEKLIKSKKRVQQHGEVFTPTKIVNDMLNLEGLREKVEDIRGMVLEPAVGEGVFLVEILKRRLKYLLNTEDSILDYENKSLLALTTLYGIELLEDNAQKCVMNIYICFFEYYEKALKKFEKKSKKKVLDSARTIISTNIAQGNFLTQQTNSGELIVLSEWREVETSGKRKNIQVIRTEHTLEDIYKEIENENGFIVGQVEKKEEKKSYQISFLDYDEESNFIDKYDNQKDDEPLKQYRYIVCSILDVYREEMEEYEG